MTDERDQLKKELLRIQRVSDMLSSMHSTLRDEYSKRSTVVDCLLFVPAIVLAAFAFADPALMPWIPFDASNSRLFLGALSLATFFLSLINTRVDWKAKLVSHSNAAEAYSQMKLDCRKTLIAFDKATEVEVQALFLRYSDLGRICVAIPENNFLRLKQKHNMKVTLSRYLDRNPGTSLTLLRIKMWLSHSLAKEKADESNCENEEWTSGRSHEN